MDNSRSLDTLEQLEGPLNDLESAIQRLRAVVDAKRSELLGDEQDGRDEPDTEERRSSSRRSTD